MSTTNVDKLHVRGRLGEREEISLLSSPTSSARATSQLSEPNENRSQKASDLIRERFSVPPGAIDCSDPDHQTGGIYVERAGVAVRGKRPSYLDWPMVRGDEFARQSPLTPKARR